MNNLSMTYLGSDRYADILKLKTRFTLDFELNDPEDYHDISKHLEKSFLRTCDVLEKSDKPNCEKAIGDFFLLLLLQGYCRGVDIGRIEDFIAAIVEEISGNKKKTDQWCERFELLNRELDPESPFLGWHLSELAACAHHPPSDELVDKAIAAFERIVDRPIDPGNDLGPFTEISYYMNAEQVRRSLIIVKKMYATYRPDKQHLFNNWCGLETSEAYLIARLAELGHIDEAQILMNQIKRERDYKKTSGKIYAFRIIQGYDWSFPDDNELERDFLEGVANAFSCAVEYLPEPPFVKAFIPHICGKLTDNYAKNVFLGRLLSEWQPVVSMGWWVSIVKEYASGDEQIDMLLELVENNPKHETSPVIVKWVIKKIKSSFHLSDSSWQLDFSEYFDQLLKLRAFISIQDIRWVFSHVFLCKTYRIRCFFDLKDKENLRYLLLWIGGDGVADELKHIFEAFKWIISKSQGPCIADR